MGAFRAGVPRSSVGLLVGRISSRHGWLQGLWCLKVAVGSLLGGTGSWCCFLRAQYVPELELVCWWAVLGPKCPGAGAGLLVGGLRLSIAGCRAVVVLGTLGLVPYHQWVRLAPEAIVSPLLAIAGSWGLCLQVPGGPGSSTSALVCRAKSWVLW